MTDERLGLPSISELERLALCPGSYELTRYVYALHGRQQSSGAESGNKIHAALSGEDIELSRYEGWTKERCEEYEAAVLAQLKEEYGFEPVKENREWKRLGYAPNPLREVRLNLSTNLAEKLATGMPDVVYSGKDATGHALCVIDYKTGTIGAGIADLNYQLTGYAVVGWQTFGKTPLHVFVALVQPNAPDKISVAELGYEDLKRAEKGVIDIILKATSGTTERHADIEKQCKYCPAQGFCPEFVAASSKAITLSPDLEVEVSLNAKTAAEDFIMNIAATQDVVKIFEKRAVLEAILDAVKRRLKTELQGNPESVPGYELVPSGAVRTIPDIEAALNSIKDIAERKEFMAALKLSITDLEKLHKKNSGLKGKSAEEDFERRFGDLIVREPKEMKIAKVKV